MSGAGIMLVSGDGPRGSLCTTDPISALLETLQFDLGEGPCIDAFQLGRPVVEPDLVNPRQSRWAAFAPAALEAGVRAVFGFPMRVGAVRFGSLNLHRRDAGALTDDQHADGLVMADVAAQMVLALQAQAPAGALSVELEAHLNTQSVVHQASGMVAAQLDAPIGEALVRLRAYAFASGRRLDEIAKDVVARRLRFDEGTSESDG